MHFKSIFKMKKLGIFCLLFILALSSCRDNIDDVTTTVDPFVPPIVNYNPQSLPVNGSVTGFVADEMGEPVINADVKVGNESTTTDDFGHFFLTGITLDAKGTIVSVKKNGYFAGSRRFYALENKVNRVKIELLSSNITDSFDAALGGTVATPDGASATFAPNSIKKMDGSVYNGVVNVSSKWLNPADPKTLDQMPGNLMGVNSKVEEVVLGTYGMMAVELTSDAGELLNIADGKTATLNMPVPAALQASAPAEIPFWSYNEEYGVWVEEGSATLQGGVYVGEVAHFSFWNCDIWMPLVNFEATVVDADDNPLSNFKVGITIETGSGPFTGCGYTAADGTVSGLIPANTDLVLEVFDLCGEVIYSENIGPFSDDVDYGTIIVVPSTMTLSTVTGQIIDCNGAPVSEGVALIQFSGQTAYAYTSTGAFEVTFSTCSSTDTLEVVGVDLSNLKQSDPVWAESSSMVDVGLLSACDQQLDNYILLTVDDGTNVMTVIYSPAQAFVDSTATGLFGTGFSYFENNNPAGSSAIYFSVDGQATGDYSSSNYLEIFNDPNNNLMFGQGENFSQFNISEYGNFSEPVIGTFGGTLTNWGVQPPVQVTVSGQFNLLLQ